MRGLRLASVSTLFLVVAWDARGCARTPAVVEIPCDTIIEGDGIARPALSPGEYTLTLVAADGRSASGTMQLREYPTGQTAAAARSALGGGATYPLYGSARLPLESIGAEAFGSIESTEIDSPGVQVIEVPDGQGAGAPTQVILRFGSDANAGGPATFEGPHTTLRVRAAWPDSFAGRWESSSGARSTGGHFCARRLPR